MSVIGSQAESVSHAHIFQSIDGLLLVENDKFNSGKYLNKILISLMDDAKVENADYLDLNKLIVKLKHYLEDDILSKKYSLLIKQFYSVFIKLAAVDNTKKDRVNEAIIKNLTNLVELAEQLDRSSEEFIKNKVMVDVLVRSYNCKFAFYLFKVICDVVLCDLQESRTDISVDCVNYETTNTALSIIKNCNNIGVFDAISYAETNCKNIKTGALKNLQSQIIKEKYTHSKGIWQLIINNSKKDFILTVDKVMVDLILSTQLPLNNFHVLVKSLIEKNEKMVEFENFLVKDIAIYQNYSTNSSEEMEDPLDLKVSRNISGLAYYKSIKFNDNLKCRNLSFIYFGKVAKNLNKTASIQLSKNKKNELWQLIKTEFSSNEELSKTKDFDLILKHFEIILNSNI